MDNRRRLLKLVVSLWIGITVLSFLPNIGWGRIKDEDRKTNVCMFGNFLTKEYILLNFSIVVFLVWCILLFTNFFLIYGLLKVYFRMGKVSPEEGVDNDPEEKKRSERWIEMKELDRNLDNPGEIEEYGKGEGTAHQDIEKLENMKSCYCEQKTFCSRSTNPGQWNSAQGIEVKANKKNGICSNDHVNNEPQDTEKNINKKDTCMRRKQQEMGEETPLKRQRNSTKKAVLHGENLHCVEGCRRNNLAKRERKATVMVVVIVSLFIFLTAPIITMDLISMWCRSCPSPPHIIVLLAICMIYANACVNPIIYAGLNSEYRKTFITILRKMRDAFRF